MPAAAGADLQQAQPMKFGPLRKAQSGVSLEIRRLTLATSLKVDDAAQDVEHLQWSLLDQQGAGSYLDPSTDGHPIVRVRANRSATITSSIAAAAQ